MNKEAVFAHFSSVIDNLIDNSLFFSNYFQRPYFLDEDILGEEENSQMPSNISLYGGATRVCIVDNDYDYVVKFDIDEDHFGSACEREERIFNDAAARNLQDYFAEVMFLGFYTKTIRFYDADQIEQHMSWYGYDPIDFDNSFADHEHQFGHLHDIEISVPLYGYKRAEHYKCDETYDNDSKEMSIANSITSPLKSRNVHIAASFVHEFGEAAYREFSEFGIEHKINDIHFGNIGSIDGHLCLIDYAGYHSFDDYDEEGNYYGSDSNNY